jgi:hypothetical protein
MKNIAPVLKEIREQTSDDLVIESSKRVSYILGK